MLKAYVDYYYYTDEYAGEKVKDVKIFKRLALEASAFINAITFGRVPDPEEIDPAAEVKIATCAVIDVLDDYENGRKGIQSESVGQVSRTYAGASESNREQDCRRAAYTYLAGTGLLYRGD